MQLQITKQSAQKSVRAIYNKTNIFIFENQSSEHVLCVMSITMRVIENIAKRLFGNSGILLQRFSRMRSSQGRCVYRIT